MNELEIVDEEIEQDKQEDDFAYEKEKERQILESKEYQRSGTNTTLIGNNLGLIKGNLNLIKIVGVGTIFVWIALLIHLLGWI